MLEKIEFSDIYKFLSSVGLVLILAAVLLPIYLFQIDITKYCQNIDSKQISETVKHSILLHDNLTFSLLKCWPFISLLAFVFGALLFGYGIFRWNKRQIILDKMQDLDLQGKEKIIKEASQEEVNKKLNEDADEIEEIEEDDGKRSLVLESYKAIESRVIDSIKTDDPNIRINHNARVNNFVYDLIIIKYLDNRRRLHKVCEIKYYQKEIFYSYVKHGISSFLLAVSNYEKLVADDPRIIAEYYMIWICTNSDQKIRLERYTRLAREYSAEKGVNLNIIIKLESELESIRNVLL